MNEFLDACQGKKTPFTPIWLMRQAGRYQPEYMAIKAKYSFMEMCQNPEIATEVTMLPIKQFNLDAAIIFADILLILEPMGIGFEFTKDHGPRIDQPIRSAADVDRTATVIDPKESLGYVLDAIRLVRKELDGKVPLIGFSGAPFTLASYCIEGGGSRDYHFTKQMMYSDPGAFSALMTKLTDGIIGYLNAQIEAGAQAVQIFDSWIGALSAYDYDRFVKPHMTRLFAALDKSVPVIHFGTGNPALYPSMKEAGGDVLGVDWRVDLGEQRKLLGDIPIMGNMDPNYLIGPKSELEAAAQRVLDSAGGKPGHIFNLGHGIFPQVPVDQVRALVDYVHEASSR